MSELPTPVSFLIILTVLITVSLYIWTQTGDIFTGQGCETMELCRNITDIIPEWLRI